MKIFITVFLAFLSFKGPLPPGEKVKIKAQKELSTEEQTSITISLSDLTVEADPQVDYPTGFYIKMDPGRDYDFTNQTVTPKAGFLGELKVKIEVTNGQVHSKKFDLKIDVRKGSEHPNQPPVITGQNDLTVQQGMPLTLDFEDLVVADADDQYPTGFTLTISPGTDYTVHENTITPQSQFIGTLEVEVRVNDGNDDSNIFNLKVSVIDSEPNNIAPIIIGQSSLTTFKNESIKIEVTSLAVSDPDNKFPNDFELLVQPGNRYTFSGTTVMPENNFVGIFHVNIIVNDGQNDSEPYSLNVNVVERDQIQIVGHDPLIIGEDSPLTITLNDLHVADPLNEYPQNYSLRISEGSNYSISDDGIVPSTNFNGNLFVKLSVEKPGVTSNIYEALVLVYAVNDPPEFVTFSEEPITARQENVFIASEIVIGDVDDDKLYYAEVVNELPLEGVLAVSSESTLQHVYDTETGALILLGEASVKTYEEEIRQLTFTYTGGTDSVRSTSISFRLFDGKDYSKLYKKNVILGDEIPKFNFPGAFTPNNDNANDTWEIGLREFAGRDDYQMVLRIYSKQGLLLFESNDPGQPWDGKLNGTELPPETYFYTLLLDNGRKVIPLRGTVTILK